jgi:hypothetical protein
MLRWTFTALPPRQWIGTVDADAAIKDAAKEFNIEDPKKLFAVPRRATVHYGRSGAQATTKSPAPFSRPSCGSGHP